MNALRACLDQFLRHYLVAVQYFTRVPVRGGVADFIGFTPDMLRASAPHFPGVGWLAGMAACVAFAVLSIGLPDGPLTPVAAAVGCTIATVALTGACHEKSLAALWGSTSLTLALLFKVALLGVLAIRSPGALATALLAAHTVSRFWPLVIVHTLPLAGGEPVPSSRPLYDRVERRALAVAAAWCVVPLALMALAHGLLFVAMALGVSGLALWGLRRWLQVRLQGFTGDALGAAQQVCEIAFYVGAGFGLSSR